MSLFLVVSVLIQQIIGFFLQLNFSLFPLLSYRLFHSICINGKQLYKPLPPIVAISFTVAIASVVLMCNNASTQGLGGELCHFYPVQHILKFPPMPSCMSNMEHVYRFVFQSHTAVFAWAVVTSTARLYLLPTVLSALSFLV